MGNTVSKDPEHIIHTGGNPVLAVLEQLAYFDDIEHEGKLGDNIKHLIGEAKPTTADVVRALVLLLVQQSEGRDDCITVHALGDLHYEELGLEAYDQDRPTSNQEFDAVAAAEAFAGALGKALDAILLRPEHGTSEAF